MKEAVRKKEKIGAMKIGLGLDDRILSNLHFTNAGQCPERESRPAHEKQIRARGRWGLGPTSEEVHLGER